MDRSELAQWWDEAFTEGVWWAPWRGALEGLTAEEAAWQPTPDRHSIWQMVEHMIFWQEYFADRNEGAEPRSEQEVSRLNWQPNPEPDEAAWRRARERFATSHARVRRLLQDPQTPAPPKPQLDLRYLLLHDSYHIGQVMYVRALLGKEALEA